MSLVYLLLPLSLLLSLLGLGAFFWASRSGQFDDLESPDKRLLFEEVSEREKAVEGEPQFP